ncbi:HNH endonuclease [Streptomyces sp. bgisy032]|uniref:HNH endonuclease n=1 Tax=Streptomyces sp. bgisy032 TaxID=3413773 RepID=UPI003D758C2F
MNVSPLSDRGTRSRLNRRLAALGVPAKACGACLVVKGLDAFPLHQRGLQGRHTRCRPCHRDAQAVRRQDPAYRAAERRQQRPYDRQRALTDERRAYMLDRSRLRRALEAGAEYDGHQPEDVWIHWDDEGYYACVCCGGPFEHIDHNVPLIRGGSHTLDNLVPLCESCNTSKQGRCPYRFYAERFPGLRPYLEPFFDVHERLTDEELAARQEAVADSSESAT